MKLSKKGFALTCGLIWGLGLFFITWWVILFDGSSTEATFIAKAYRGYSVTPIGSVIGLGWGLVDGLIGGFIFAWLYNLLSGKMVKTG